jgi:hypothetical protein
LVPTPLNLVLVARITNPNVRAHTLCARSFFDSVIRRGQFVTSVLTLPFASGGVMRAAPRHRAASISGHGDASPTSRCGIGGARRAGASSMRISGTGELAARRACSRLGRRFPKSSTATGNRQLASVWGTRPPSRSG